MAVICCCYITNNLDACDSFFREGFAAFDNIVYIRVDWTKFNMAREILRKLARQM